MSVCIFTIVSNNYLHYANTLFDSVKEHCPEAEIVLGLCDKKNSETHCPDAEIIDLLDLKIEGLGQFIYQYTILELNTAIKPYVIEELMNRGYEKVIYIDPDIRIFDSLDEMLSLLDKHNVLLTPHLTNLLDDGKLPNELGILQAGSYNLGYIGLRTNSETRKLVKWWQEKLYKECVVDISRGLFVDQKWMDMVPSIFEGVYINRNEGWNVAYWNLNHRDIEKTKEGKFLVNGQPLLFFHYSGYSIEATTLSKHQNRLKKTSKGPALVELCKIYDECLLKNEIDRFKKIPYAFSQFADGVKVPDAARKLIREEDSLANVDYFDAKSTSKVHSYLNTPVNGSSPVLVTQLSRALWQSREDLRAQFPDVLGVDSIRFAEWLLSAAEKEAGFSSIYLDGIRESLESFRSSEAKLTQKELSIFSKVMRTCWNKREKIPLSIRLALGSNVARWAFNAAYQSTPVMKNKKEVGVNLIGYMQAESGVGEAARASLRGLTVSNLPFSVVDYRLGNVSRMNESISCDFSNIAPYSINLLHVNADQVGHAKKHLGNKIFSDQYNIGYWYWELPEFPDEFDFAFDELDEVWVSSQYNLHAIQAKTHKPVKLIPPNINIEIEKPLSREHFGLREQTFTFFHMSDVLSMHERKNPLGVIKAFNMAFSAHPDMDVKLMIKISNLDNQPELKYAILKEIESESRIELIDSYLDRNELNNLIANIDCYISLHRAEGFGLPIAEAMYLGKPVLATMWSGNVDFMNEENSVPVSYELVKVGKNIGPYSKDQTWAEPNLDDAAEKMYHLANDPALGERVGKNAAKTVKELYSPSVTAKVINQRIKELLES